MNTLALKNPTNNDFEQALFREYSFKADPDIDLDDIPLSLFDYYEAHDTFTCEVESRNPYYIIKLHPDEYPGTLDNYLNEYTCEIRLRNSHGFSLDLFSNNASRARNTISINDMVIDCIYDVAKPEEIRAIVLDHLKGSALSVYRDFYFNFDGDWCEWLDELRHDLDLDFNDIPASIDYEHISTQYSDTLIWRDPANKNHIENLESVAETIRHYLEGHVYVAEIIDLRKYYICHKYNLDMHQHDVSDFIGGFIGNPWDLGDAINAYIPTEED